MTTAPTACLHCHRPMRSKHAPAQPGTVRHDARGLCFTCYRQAYYAGDTMPPRITGLNIDAVRELAAQGMTDRQIGDRLGATKDAVCHARLRAGIPAGRASTRKTRPARSTANGPLTLPDVEPAIARAAARTVARHVPVDQVRNVLDALGLAAILTTARSTAA